VKVPILANLTEFGSTPFFTTEELGSADVDIALYCCGAYRAMNKAALGFYETVRREGIKPKKSVALSGVAAGNTALCTVGRTGNDLHYRGYDILDFATTCEFEEIAHLLVHGKLPNRAELAGYKAKLKALRGCPASGQGRAGATAAVGAPDGRDAHRRVGAGLRAAGEGRPQPSGRARHRRPPDGLAGLDAAVLVPLQPQRQAHRGGNRRRLHRRPLPAPAARREAPRICGCAPCTPR
jgi:hypothetical protein